MAAGDAPAQTPAAPAAVPAKTQWAKFPPPSVNPPAPTPAPPPPLPAAGGPGSRVVVFTKPAGDVRPVQATEPARKPEPEKKPDPAKPTDPEKRADPPEKKTDGPITPPTPPKESPGAAEKPQEKGNPFRLRSDEEMGADVAEEINRERRKQFDAERGAFEENLRRFNLGLDKERPPEPKLTLLAAKDVIIARPLMTPAPPVKSGYAPVAAVLEPGYVVHRRLFFEEKNAERYGWDLGAVQPLLSTAYFVKDVVLLPGHVASSFFERYDTSAGKCPPGSPVAYYLYPPQITLKGGLVEAGVIVGVAALLP